MTRNPIAIALVLGAALALALVYADDIDGGRTPDVDELTDADWTCVPTGGLSECRRVLDELAKARAELRAIRAELRRLEGACANGTK